MSSSWYMIGAAALLFFASARAQTQLVLKDAAGTELRRLSAVALADGIVATGREGLIGAASALRLGAQATGVVAEDPDADFVLLRLPRVRTLSPVYPGDIPRGTVLAGSGFAAAVDNRIDVPGFGTMYRLRYAKDHPAQSEPLWNEQGQLAAWYLPKTIDGQRFSFAVPIVRLLCLSPGRLLPLQEWNTARQPEMELAYARSLGYFWLQDFDGAAYHFNQLARRNPTHARVWFYLAFSEGKMGRNQRKVDAYRRTVELAPNWGEPRYNLGLALLLNGDRQGALAEAAVLASIDPVMAQRLSSFIDITHVDPLPAKPVRLAEPSSPPPTPR